MHSIISAGSLNEPSQAGGHSFLLKVIMEWPRLSSGGKLLPFLIELYRWLHTNISHLISYEHATSLTIGQVIKNATQTYTKKYAEYILHLYTELKERYNLYVKEIGTVIGAGACLTVHTENQISAIHDDIPLLHFLSGK